MKGAFFPVFDSALPDMETQFSEEWTFNGVTWPAIAIDALDMDDHIIKGGVIVNAHVRIFVREEVFQASGVELGSYVTARGVEFSVGSIQSDGDASRTLICAPKGIDVWR